MPELPEVETIRRDLEKAVINKKIIALEIRKSKSIKNNRLNDFKKDLIGTKIISINRIGKLLYFMLEKAPPPFLNICSSI